MQITINDAVKNTASILVDFLLKKSTEEILGIYELLLSESSELGHLKIDEPFFERAAKITSLLFFISKQTEHS